MTTLTLFSAGDGCTGGGCTGEVDGIALADCTEGITGVGDGPSEAAGTGPG